MSSTRMAYGEQTTLAERKRRAGQRLIIGLGGPSPTAEERALIAQAAPAGFILFTRNLEEPAQLRELNRELQSLVPASRPPMLSIDQEGGRVQRVRETEWPAMRTLGNYDHPATTRQVGAAMGTELAAMGFNLNFAPVTDVDSNPRNPVIGDRAFSDKPAKVLEHALAYLAGLHAADVSGCVKHFPGHGDTAVDSHLDLPIVEKERPELDQIELPPFVGAVRSGVEMVMTAHVLFPEFDEQHPATMSWRILHGLLREELGFGGLICSDDLSMKAVRGRYPLEVQLDLACRATVDVFLASKPPELAVDAFETLVRLQEQETVHDLLAVDSNKRVDAWRLRFLKNRAALPDLSVVGNAGFKALAAQLNERAIS